MVKRKLVNGLLQQLRVEDIDSAKSTLSAEPAAEPATEPAAEPAAKPAGNGPVISQTCPGAIQMTTYAPGRSSS